MYICILFKKRILNNLLKSKMQSRKSTFAWNMMDHFLKLVINGKAFCDLVKEKTRNFWSITFRSLKLFCLFYIRGISDFKMWLYYYEHSVKKFEVSFPFLFNNMLWMVENENSKFATSCRMSKIIHSRF